MGFADVELQQHLAVGWYSWPSEPCGRRAVELASSLHAVFFAGQPVPRRLTLMRGFTSHGSLVAVLMPWQSATAHQGWYKLPPAGPTRRGQSGLPLVLRIPSTLCVHRPAVPHLLASHACRRQLFVPRGATWGVCCVTSRKGGSPPPWAVIALRPGDGPWHAGRPGHIQPRADKARPTPPLVAVSRLHGQHAPRTQPCPSLIAP